MEDYTSVNRVCKDFKMKYLGKYHDLHVQSDTLLLGLIFQAVHRYGYGKANNKHMKDYDKNKEPLYLKILRYK